MNTFRVVNDRIRAFDTYDDSDLAFFVCECESVTCFRTVPLMTDEYDALRATGGTIYADDCAIRPVLADVLVSERARLVIDPDTELTSGLLRRVAVPVADAGLPVEGAPAG